MVDTGVAPPVLGRAARALGLAGLLPQLLAVAVVAGDEPLAGFVALIYAALIGSFLGGMWWGFAMVAGRYQGRLAAIAVVPTLLITAATVPMLVDGQLRGPLVAIGLIVAATLPVDRWLERVGIAPAGWFGFRALLSAGLGGLTILCAALLPAAL